jgi:hypothetical protein
MIHKILFIYILIPPPLHTFFTSNKHLSVLSSVLGALDGMDGWMGWLRLCCGCLHS